MDMENEADPFGGDYLHTIRINDEITVNVPYRFGGVPFDVLETQ